LLSQESGAGMWKSKRDGYDRSLVATDSKRSPVKGWKKGRYVGNEGSYEMGGQGTRIIIVVPCIL
jgi:hypothetical protein